MGSHSMSSQIALGEFNTKFGHVLYRLRYLQTTNFIMTLSVLEEAVCIGTMVVFDRASKVRMP